MVHNRTALWADILGKIEIDGIDANLEKQVARRFGPGSTPQLHARNSPPKVPQLYLGKSRKSEAKSERPRGPVGAATTDPEPHG